MAEAKPQQEKKSSISENAPKIGGMLALLAGLVATHRISKGMGIMKMLKDANRNTRNFRAYMAKNAPEAAPMANKLMDETQLGYISEGMKIPREHWKRTSSIHLNQTSKPNWEGQVSTDLAPRSLRSPFQKKTVTILKPYLQSLTPRERAKTVIRHEMLGHLPQHAVEPDQLAIANRAWRAERFLQKYLPPEMAYELSPLEQAARATESWSFLPDAYDPSGKLLVKRVLTATDNYVDYLHRRADELLPLNLVKKFRNLVKK